MIALRAGLLMTLSVLALDLFALELDHSALQSHGSACLVVTHHELDGYAEYLDRSDQVLARAGSWLGRDSRYLLRPLEKFDDPDHYRIRVLGLDGEPAGEDQLTLATCPSDLDPRFASALFEAQNLRLARYLGQPVSSEAISRHYERALERVRAQPAEWQGLLYFEWAAHLRALSRPARALSFYTLSAEQFRLAGDTAREAAAINSRGLAFWRSGQPDSALADFHTVLKLRGQTGDLFGLAVTDNNLGLVLLETGQVDEAELALERALSHFQGTLDLRRPIDSGQVDQPLAAASTVDLPAALNTLNNLALLQRDRGRIELAERYWRNYLALGQHLPRAQALAEARLNLARLLLDQGRIDEVLDPGSRALDAFMLADRGRWVALASVLLAEAHEWLGDRDQAMRYLKQAVSLSRDDDAVAAEALRSLSWLRFQSGDPAAARAALADARDRIQQDGPAPLRVRIELELTWLDWQTGQLSISLSQAIEAFESGSLELIGLGQLRQAASNDSRRAELLADDGRGVDAIDLLEQVIARQDALGDRLESIISLERLGRIQAELGASALQNTLERALARIETIHAGNLPPLRRAEFLAASRRLYDRLVIFLVDRGLHDEAWQVAQRARGRGLRQAQGWRDRQQRSGRVERLLDQRAVLVEQHFVQVRLDSEARPASQTAQTRQALDRLDIELERLRMVRPSPANPGLRAVQARLDKDQLLISYYLAGDRLLAWQASAESTRLTALGSAADLNLVISDLISRLRHPRQALAGTKQRLSDLHERLIAPLEIEADPLDILVQPDGVLASVPWGLLFDPGSDNGHDDGPSVSQWLGRPPDARPIPGEPSMLLLGDPGWSDPGDGHEGLPDQSLLARVLGRPAAARLPGSRREAEAIAEMAGRGVNAHAVTLRLGQQASREFIIAGGLENYRRVHIASHGLVDLEYPELSALVLASESGRGPAFLRPHDIAELDLNAELVVLSGCATGAGKILAGEGALSLARPFLIAGARQVLASLWTIDDHRTAEFMARFYQHLLIDQDPPARALRQAQNWMRQQPGSAHPYYWAGFTLIQA